MTNMFKSHRGSPAILLVCIFPLIGCGVGYKVDKSNDKVVWVTWDEGNGRREWPVDGADAKTFEVMPLRTRTDSNCFGKYKNHVYFAATRIEGADPSSFREYGTDYRDDKSVFLWIDGNIKQLPDSDPESFMRIDELFWSRDSKQVFFLDRGFVPRDLATFELLEGLWARDRKAHYYEDREVPEAHRDTFKVDPVWPSFGRDREHVFWQGRTIHGADPQSFVITKHNEGHDNKTNFYCFFEDSKLRVLKRPAVGPGGNERP